MKILIHDGKEYEFLNLLKYTTDKNISHLFTGDVINKETGEVFDISVLKDKYNEQNLMILENLNHLPHKDKMKVLEWTTKGYDVLRESELLEKFESKLITYEECKELLLIKNYKKRDILKVKYGEFYLVNKMKKKPKELSSDYYGKFHMLIAYFMSCRNRLEHIENGKPISKKDLLEAMEVKTERAFEILIKKLCDLKLIAKGKLGNRKYLVINPAYANMQFQISFEVYELFKEDLDELLDPIEIRMLELSVIDNNSPFIPYE